MDVKGKQAVVIGLGESGLAMAKWLAREGARVRVADSRPLPPNADAFRAAVPAAELVTGPFQAATFAGADFVAISPGVPVEQVQSLIGELPLVSEIELFAWAVRSRTPAAKIIAITGSNGKTTTTALTGALAAAAGVNTRVAGNISPAALDALMDALDGNDLPALWVLELSSFQLETTHSLDAEAATVLNVSEDHLDRYAGSMDLYAEAKARVFQGKGAMILNRDDNRSLGLGRCGRPFVTFGLDQPGRATDYGVADSYLVRGSEKLLALADMQLTGLHNAANAMAALALLEAVGIAPAAVLAALKAFKGLPHRVEHVANIGGVDYYDDSKGTNVGATLAAIEGLGRPLAIVLGGDGKGQDFSPLKAALQQHGRAVALIGKDGPAIGVAIAGCGVPTASFADMAGAVQWLASQAQSGDAVLLSPACASLDMYKNYAHRAEAFIAAVRKLGGQP
ncbi:MAG TPA: UDP-N-acetylmuramoyl-L-alanine--D-glutamate ligase [Azospira sp.]|nr:UDP-N-acetylmuramoyl-L-alanine--D-glutamate ligase [Azospira sp.]